MTPKQFAIKIAKAAGKIIRQNFKHGMKKQWKDNDTPVTVTDIAINKMVIAGVKKNFPTHDVLGEEESYQPNKGKYLWVCDPIDGTVPFSHGMPNCVFSLALVRDGVPILGVIYDPFVDRLVYAEKGKGAFLNGKRIHVNKKPTKFPAICWESISTVQQLKAEFPKSFIFMFYSYIYGAMLVATGEVIGAVYTWHYAHDCASIKVVVEEAGGKVTDLNGNNQRYDGPVNGMLVSNGVYHKKLLQIIKKHHRNFR